MNAPKIQRIGKKIPKKNSHPCPFLRVMTPNVTARTSLYRLRLGVPGIPVGRAASRTPD